jgi:hypothetical protein
MGTTRRKARSRKHRDRAGVSDAGPRPRVERLRQDFAKFRRGHPLRTRIPDSLRNAALAALRSGTSESEMRRACGVTSDQLAQWRKHQQACTQARDLDGQTPRVFPVVDDMAGNGMTDAGERVQQDLELRIGGWAICVRQVEE